ncbi:hypothetical protein EV138_2343 [Kribbella voronezhensis]|uniref:Uncharacterized protein n=1 Tax=Kribbella voronezhensis TaxID=2512212 RepID=A0A4R7T9Z3_9ACTN|nr:hypothetical protein EV138_2343 [Kribbella voronezhensis]
MPDYAGVIAWRDNQIAVVREHYEGWDEENWNLPPAPSNQASHPKPGLELPRGRPFR